MQIKEKLRHSLEKKERMPKYSMTIDGLVVMKSKVPFWRMTYTCMPRQVIIIFNI